MWWLDDYALMESVFTHSARGICTGVVPETPVVSAGGTGGCLRVVVAPPAHVESTEIGRRELVFALDTSGSMRGVPIEKGKAVVAR